ncbi:MAG: hypothetical protein LBL13_09570 [Bacteroidales bacterium]|jgi:hypothetical protein|nr:hypothetical protein [Bacteroidales bacterium]
MVSRRRIENKALKAHIVEAGYGAIIAAMTSNLSEEEDYECNLYYTTKQFIEWQKITYMILYQSNETNFTIWINRWRVVFFEKSLIYATPDERAKEGEGRKGERTKGRKDERTKGRKKERGERAKG